MNVKLEMVVVSRYATMYRDTITALAKMAMRKI